MDANVKQWIDNATYAQLLQRWRFSGVGDPMFKGDTGVYFEKRMKELRSAPGGEEMHTAASKEIGW